MYPEVKHFELRQYICTQFDFKQVYKSHKNVLSFPSRDSVIDKISQGSFHIQHVTSLHLLVYIFPIYTPFLPPFPLPLVQNFTIFILIIFYLAFLPSVKLLQFFFTNTKPPLMSELIQQISEIIFLIGSDKNPI